jgi:hypothetical protein
LKGGISLVVFEEAEAARSTFRCGRKPKSREALWEGSEVSNSGFGDLVRDIAEKTGAGVVFH